MRWILLLVLFGTEAPLLAQQKNPIYDSVLAAKLGADDYGMKKYVLVILQTGKKEEKNQVRRDSLFAEHMANINRLVKAGKMIVAGPLKKMISSIGVYLSCRWMINPKHDNSWMLIPPFGKAFLI